MKSFHPVFALLPALLLLPVDAYAYSLRARGYESGEDDKNPVFRYGQSDAVLWLKRALSSKQVKPHNTSRWSSSRGEDLSQFNGQSAITLDGFRPGSFTITNVRKGNKVKTLNVVIVNDAPRASITSPANYDDIGAGPPLVLRGNATDREDDAFGLGPRRLSWQVFGPDFSKTGNGETLRLTDLRPGEYHATLDATDTAGASDSVSITFAIVNNAPLATIAKFPTNVDVGKAIDLEGSGTDLDSSTAPKDPDTGIPLPEPIPAGRLAWSWSIEGSSDWNSIDTGTEVSFTPERLGTTRLTVILVRLTATDEWDAPGTATVRVTVKNELPEVTTTSPSAGDSISIKTVEEEGILFEATVNDPDGFDIADSDVVWAANEKALPVKGRSAVNSLPPGEHEIDCWVTDTHGGKKKRSIGTIEVTNDPPEIDILAPLGEARDITVKETELGVTFQADVSDPEGFDIPDSSVRWSSNIQTLEQRQGRTVSNVLKPGTHRITVKATDKHKGSHEETFSMKVTNNPPKVEITAPAASAYNTATIGQAGKVGVLLEADVSDPDGFDIESSKVVWRSSKDGDLSNTGPSVRNLLSVGGHLITCTVTDKHGATRTSQEDVTLEVTNTPPTLTLNVLDKYGSPKSFFTAAEEVRIQARVHDPDGFDFSAQNIQIVSSVDGPCPGATEKSDGVWELRSDALSANGPNTTHRITVTVTDAHNGTDQQSLEILITNSKPKVEIRSPDGGDHFHKDDTIRLRARVSDDEDGDVPNSRVVWVVRRVASQGHHGHHSGGSSDAELLDNVLHILGILEDDQHVVDHDTHDDYDDYDYDSSFRKVLKGKDQSITDLDPGTYRIFLQAADQDGLASRRKSVRIEIDNRSPTAEIRSPTSGQEFLEGKPVTLRARANDPEDGQLDGDHVVWSLLCSTGEELDLTGRTPAALTDLPVGNHTVTLKVTDEQGESDTASVGITIKANKKPEPVIQRPADGDEVMEGTALVLTGNAFDNETGALPGNKLVWVIKDQGGQRVFRKAGKQHSVTTLAPGDYTVILRVKDPDDPENEEMTGRARVNITVKPKPAPPPAPAGDNGGILGNVEEAGAGG